MGPMTKLCIWLKDFLEKPLARRACLIALAFATMLNLQTLPLGGRLLGLQNGENFLHLTESERCESFPRFHNLSMKQKKTYSELWSSDLEVARRLSAPAMADEQRGQGCFATLH